MKDDPFENAKLSFGASEFQNELGIIARAMNEEIDLQRSALRILLRYFSKWDASDLVRMASDKSARSVDHQWFLTIRTREDNQRPDGGLRRRHRERISEIEEIGITCYRFRQSGMNDKNSLEATIAHLKLYLTPRTVRSKVQDFRKLALRQQTSNFYDKGLTKILASMGLAPADLMRKGRPKKMVQSVNSRTALFPAMKPR